VEAVANAATVEPSAGDVGDLAEEIATACQVIAATGLADGVLGHVSARIGPDTLLIRCRGPRESGLAYTVTEDVHPMRFDRPTPSGGWSPPNELPIHTEIMRARPDVTAVVHVHPPDVVAMSVAGFPFEPVIGAYDIPAARMAADGIPVWPRACLVNTAELGRALSDCLGERPVAVLRGHGLVSVATGPPDRAVARAVVQAVAVTSLATMTLRVRAAGGRPEPIDDEDLAGLPDLGDGFNVDAMWRHLSRMAAARRIYCS
jgi:3,4-dihydroxyphthalate decarboxylase